MNFKPWISVAAALCLGLIAAVLAYRTLPKAHVPVPAPASVSVVVVKSPLPAGYALRNEDLQLAPIAAKAAPANAFTTLSALAGRVTMAPMVAGQPVLKTLLAPEGTGSGLQAIVPPGMRAITLEINESTGLGGLLNPGCHVDVVAAAVDVGNMDKSISRTIVQNAQVVAVGQRMAGHAVAVEGQKDQPLPHTVTLLVWPHDAEALDLAMSAVRPRLALRGSGDTSDADDTGVMMAELRGASGSSLTPSAQSQTGVFNSSATAPATQPADGSVPAADPTRVVTVIMGNDERRVVFRQDASKVATGSAQVSDTDDHADHH